MVKFVWLLLHVTTITTKYVATASNILQFCDLISPRKSNSILTISNGEYLTYHTLVNHYNRQFPYGEYFNNTNSSAPSLKFKGMVYFYCLCCSPISFIDLIYI